MIKGAASVSIAGALLLVLAFIFDLGEYFDPVEADPATVGVVLLLAGPVVLLIPLFVSLIGRARQAELDDRRINQERLAEYRSAGWQLEDPGLQIFGTSSNVVCGRHAGVFFEHKVVHKGQDSAPLFTLVSVKTAAQGRFLISPERGPDGTIGGEYKTGLPAFDRHHHFGGASEEYFRSVFTVKENMTILLALFRHFHTLQLSEGMLTVSKAVPRARFLARAELERTIEHLAKLKLP